MESIGHMIVIVERVLWLRLRVGTEPRAICPIVRKIEVVSRWFALAKAEDVDERHGERDDGDAARLPEPAVQPAEQQQQCHHEDEGTGDDEPEQVAVEFPRAPGGVVGAVRVGETQLVVFHLLKCAYVHGGAVDAECGEERFHDHRSARDDETADDREFARVGIAAADGEAAANHADGAEDKADEHDDAHCFACALSQTAAGGLGEDGHRSQ